MNQDANHQTSLTRKSSNPRVKRAAVLMVVVILLFYLFREHWDHLLGYWAYLILLLCPAMHLLHGHGHHKHHNTTADKD
jgi:hypothetical protein